MQKSMLSLGAPHLSPDPANNDKAGQGEEAAKPAEKKETGGIKEKEKHLVHVNLKKNRRIEDDKVVYDESTVKFTERDFKTFLVHAKSQGVLKIGIKHPKTKEMLDIEKTFNTPAPVKADKE